MTPYSRTPEGPPRAILMATNLGPGSDRALERATLQARKWNARLVVVHVVDEALNAVFDTRQVSPDAHFHARQQLEATLPKSFSNISIHIETGDTAEAILRVAEREGCDLIVMGVAEDDFLSQLTLGRPFDRLVRHTTAPILVVRDAPHLPYENVVVALELSDAARPALETAAQFFPGQPLTALHAADAPMAGLAADAPDYRAAFRRSSETEARSFLAETLSEELRDRVHLSLATGPPTTTLSAYALSHNVDLVVAGTHGRGALGEAFVGSVAKDLAESLPCDTLLVRL